MNNKKPIELLQVLKNRQVDNSSTYERDYYDYLNYNWSGYAHLYRLLRKYLNENCVLAYKLNQFGVCFIIQGKRKLMAFAGFNKNPINCFDKNLSRTTVKRAIEIINQNQREETLLAYGIAIPQEEKN